MQKRAFFLVIATNLLFLFVSCYNQLENKELKSPVPDDVLSKERMVRLLTQMHLIEGAIIQHQQMGHNTVVYTSYYFNDLFNKEQLDYKTIKRSLMFYSSRNSEFEQIYDEVLENLSKMQSESLSK